MDFDGDGKADLVIYHPSGLWEGLLANGNYSTKVSVAWGLSTDVPIGR